MPEPSAEPRAGALDGVDPATAGLMVGDEALLLPDGIDPGRTYDVLINSQHVWSLQPARDSEEVEGRRQAPWPNALRRHLNGHAEVAVREHVEGGVVARAHHVFAGAADREVSVRDSDGRELVLDKWGRLIRPLADEDEQTVAALMNDVVRLLTVLNDDCGLPAYVAYGTLLGAVREGRLIGYDNDIDLAYVSQYEQPVDVAREGFRVQRVLQERGWTVRRGSASRLNVRLRMSDGSMRYVDVFTSHWFGPTFMVAVDVGAELSRSQIVPLGHVQLMGHQVPAPAQPEALLAATYGEGWRVPDPSFKYETPTWLSRRFGGWYGGLMKSRKHWDAFNASAGKEVPSQPSPFAQWVTERYPSQRRVLDVGTGTARDAVLFANQGRPVLGVDYSYGAVNRASRLCEQQELPAQFELLNLYDTRATLALGARLSREEATFDVYARFMVHALTDEGRANLFRLASMTLRREGRFFTEFRTVEDRGQPHWFGRHFRRYLEPDQVVGEIEATGGTVVHREEGQGLARFHTEDPHMCRLVAEWAAG